MLVALPRSSAVEHDDASPPTSRRLVPTQPLVPHDEAAPRSGPLSDRPRVAATPPWPIASVPPAPPAHDLLADRRRARRRWFVLTALCAAVALAGVALVVSVMVTRLSERAGRKYAVPTEAGAHEGGR
jgi:hypothetical protein